MLRSEAEARKAIVELIAFRTPWANKIMLHDEAAFPGLAERLGVTQELLREAVAKYRLGFVPETDGRKLSENIHLFIPSALYVSVKAIARKSKMKPSSFLRSFLHAVMLTTREPSVRLLKTGSTTVLGEEDIDQDQKDGPYLTTHMTLLVSTGLAEALRRRAAAQGFILSEYAVRWLADLHEFRLKDLEVVPIAAHQMYDRVDAYVIPVESPPEVALTTN